MNLPIVNNNDKLYYQVFFLRLIKVRYDID